MKAYDTFTREQLDIVTILSSSEKATVFLVCVKEGRQMAVLKEYAETGQQEFYLHIQQLRSGYLPEIYRIWEEQGHTYLLEEYISGRTLRDILGEAELLQQKQLQGYMVELCRGLETLHRAVPPIIHRDIKPENIMITDEGGLKLLDFDAAREYKEAQERDTVLLGTREYASPEQFGFMQTDVRSDIYSVGVVFAELLEHASVTDRYRKRAGRIIGLATMFDPGKRYEQVSSLLKDLQMLDVVPYKKYIPLIGVGILLLLGLLIMGMRRSHQSIVPPTEDNWQEQSEETDGIEPSEGGPTAEVPSAAESEATATSAESIEQESSLPEEDISLATPTPFAKPVPLQEAYTYRSMEEEVLAKCYYLMAEHPDLYHGREDPYRDDGMYLPYQECIIGNDCPVLRFQRDYPREIIIRDERLEGYTIQSIYGYPYIEEKQVNGKRFELDTDGYTRDFGNVVTISQECLFALEPGSYSFYIEAKRENHVINLPFYLVVHDWEEAAENCRLYIYNEFAYYSAKSRNDVFFYVNNTPYPIQSIEIDGRMLGAEDCQLVEDGYGVVFYPEFLEQYEEREYVELVITVENGKYMHCRIIFLQNFYE